MGFGILEILKICIFTVDYAHMNALLYLGH